MLTAITTKYLGPTEKKGSRIKATAPLRRTVTIEVDDRKSMDANHKAARTFPAADPGPDGKAIARRTGAPDGSTCAPTETTPW